MRDLRDKVQYPPVSGKYKVYIIDEVHMLTDSAFNALLKTLEEPPRHAIFILATTEPHKIPATILSRCMRLDFKLIPEEDLEAHLKRVLSAIGKEYEDEAVAAIARAGAGSDRDMLSIAEMCIAYSDKLTYQGVTAVLGTADFQQMSALCHAILQSDLPAALSYTEEVLSQGKSVGVLLRDILQFFNQAAIAKTCKNAERLLSLPKDIFQKVAAVARSADSHALLRATEIFSATEMELRFSASPRISLETAIVKASSPAADYNIDALLARISRLEEELSAIKGGKTLVFAPVEQKKAPQTAKELVMDFPTEETSFERDEPVAPAPKNEPAQEVAPSVEVGEMTSQVAFGKFMRSLRKTSRNGVLFTMCSDLEAEFEGGTLVLYTDSDTVLRSLNRDDHTVLMKTAFEAIGIRDFVVKKKGAENVRDVEKRGVEKLKEDFAGYTVEIK